MIPAPAHLVARFDGIELPAEWTAGQIRRLADAIYPPDDPRSEPWHPSVAVDAGRLRHALRTLADELEQENDR